MKSIRLALLGWGIVLLGFFVAATVSHFLRPVELEWMGGAVQEHIQRVVENRPVYVAPTDEFIPFLYPPLYYWLVSGLAKAWTIPTAARIASVGCTAISATMCVLAARGLGTSRYWSAIAGLLFIGSYRYCGTWFDLERSDALMMAMLLSALVLFHPERSLAAKLLGASIAGLAFFAKQPGLIIGGAMIAAAGAGGTTWGRRAAIWGTGVASFVLPLAWLHWSTDGWFTYYCITMPGRHGVAPRLFTAFLVIDLSNAFYLTVATGTFLFLGFSRVRTSWKLGQNPFSGAKTTLFCGLGAAFATSAISRFHVGGFSNVLMFWVGFASVAAAHLSGRLDNYFATANVSSSLHGAALLIPILQLARWTADPTEVMPRAQRSSDQELLRGYVRRLEADGDVVVHGRGGITAHPHFHVAALMDILRAGSPMPPSLVAGLRARKYAAFIINDFDELSLEAMVGHRSEYWGLVLRNYFVSERLDDREPPPVVGCPAHPTWVLRPRATPLDGISDFALENRVRVEMGLAESRMRNRQAGLPTTDWKSQEALILTNLQGP